MRNWLPWAFAGLVGLAVFWPKQKKRIFISFDFDHDRQYRYLLSALDKNTNSAVAFEDYTPSAIDTDDMGRIKAALTTKIRQSTHTLVLVGKHANAKHRNSAKIGERNWIWWEIEKSKSEGKKLIAVKLEPSFESPKPLLNAGAVWARSFNVPAIVEAINKA